MDFLEKTLEEIIHKTKARKLYDRGLDCFWFDPILNLRQVKIGNYGIADLIHVTRSLPDSVTGDGWDTRININITIIELKQKEVNLGALLQAFRYKRGVQEYVEKRFPGKYKFSYSIVLIGRTFDAQSDWVYLLDDMENVQIYSYDYDFDGLSFEANSKSYALINDGFKL